METKDRITNDNNNHQKIQMTITTSENNKNMASAKNNSSNMDNIAITHLILSQSPQNLKNIGAHKN